MARYPGALWVPLPEAGAPDGQLKNKFIVHSTGSNGTAAGTRAYFASAGILNESTFIVGRDSSDPTLQIMDSTDVADANVAANDEGISVEVVGDGFGPYNAHQENELIKLGIWAMDAHPMILPQIIPSAAQFSAGFGWHIMFGAPGPWTAYAKICPGKLRIWQLQNDIFPAIFRGEVDMPLSDEDVEKVAQRVRQVIADGQRPYGLDSLRRKLDELLKRSVPNQ